MNYEHLLSNSQDRNTSHCLPASPLKQLRKERYCSSVRNTLFRGTFGMNYLNCCDPHTPPNLGVTHTHYPPAFQTSAQTHHKDGRERNHVNTCQHSQQTDSRSNLSPDRDSAGIIMLSIQMNFWFKVSAQASHFCCMINIVVSLKKKTLIRCSLGR